jgi:hypothetical protein
VQDFAPKVFRNIREFFGIHTTDYLESWTLPDDKLQLKVHTYQDERRGRVGKGKKGGGSRTTSCSSRYIPRRKEREGGKGKAAQGTYQGERRERVGKGRQLKV